MSKDEHGQVTMQVTPYEGAAAHTAERVALSPSLSAKDKTEILDILGIDRKFYQQGKKSEAYRRIKEWQATWLLIQAENEQDGPISPTTESQSRMVS